MALSDPLKCLPWLVQFVKLVDAEALVKSEEFHTNIVCINITLTTIKRLVSPSCDELSSFCDNHAVDDVRMAEIWTFERLIYPLQDLWRVC